MTPKKNIVRRQTDTLPDGTRLDLSPFGKDFTPKEARFIAWYTNPQTEAFLNAGRAAIRAGYKSGNAVTQGYLLKQKPRIAEAIKTALPSVQENLNASLWRIWNQAKTRMLWRIDQFYRTFPAKEKVKTASGDTVEIDTWDFEVIPFSEMGWAQSICIDGITYKGPQMKPAYILPNRNKELKVFTECSVLLFPSAFEESDFLRAIAEWQKVKIRKGLKGAAAYLRGE